MSNETTKLTLRLSPEVKNVIEKLSKEFGGVTASEVIRRSLGTEQFLMEEQKKGTKILLEDSGKNQRQLVFR